MVQAFRAAGVRADGVRTPPGAELVAVRREFPNKAHQGAVGGVVPGKQAQGRDGFAGAFLPVGVELLRPRIEEQIPCVVQRRSVLREQVREQGPTQRVRCGRVAEPGKGDRGYISHRVQHPRDSLRYPWCRLDAPWPAGAGRGAGEIEQVRCLHVVQVEGPGEGVEDGLGDPGEVPTLHARVVRGGDPSELSDLLAAQARNPAFSAENRQPGLLWGQAGTQRGEELLHLPLIVHTLKVTTARCGAGSHGRYLPAPGGVGDNSSVSRTRPPGA